MNLRRISSAITDSEPFRVPRPGGSSVATKTLSMFNRSQLTIEPIRLTPKPSTSAKGTQKIDIPSIAISKPLKKHAVPGPSRQLIPSSPASTSDILDGISVLPPSSCTRDRVLRSASKKKNLKNSSQVASRIPRNFGFKMPSSKNSEERPTFTAKKKSVTSMNVGRDITAPHPRLLAVAHSSPASPHSANSTEQFEADELAAALPTPARSSQQTSKNCKFNCSETLQAMQKVQQEILMSHKQFLVKQTEHLERQNQLIEKQTEVLCKLHSLLDENIKVFKNWVVSNENDGKENKVRPKRQRMVMNHSVSHEDDSGDDGKGRKKRRSTGNQIGHQAESQYNDIRSDFGFLSLKTPGKDKDGGLTVTPKTPKSILSRTLQIQLGDIFEES